VRSLWIPRRGSPAVWGGIRVAAEIAIGRMDKFRRVILRYDSLLQILGRNCRPLRGYRRSPGTTRFSHQSTAPSLERDPPICVFQREVLPIGKFKKKGIQRCALATEGATCTHTHHPGPHMGPESLHSMQASMPALVSREAGQEAAGRTGTYMAPPAWASVAALTTDSLQQEMEMGFAFERLSDNSNASHSRREPV